MDKKGEGGQQKVHTFPPGGEGGTLDVHVDKNLKKGIEESWQIMIKNQVCVFLCAKSSVIGDKVDIKLHYIELS